MRRLRGFSILVVGLFFNGFAAAQEIPEHFYPTRPYGMGGAFTAVANDENSLWTNPAGIARVRKARSRKAVDLVKVPNLVIGANKNGKAFYQGMQQSSSSVDTVAEQAGESTDQPFWGMTSIAPAIMFQAGDVPLAAAAFSHTVVKAQPTGSGLADTSILSDLGGLITFGATNASNRFNAAVQVRSIGRYAYEETIPYSTLADKGALQSAFKDGSNRSVGLAVDAGMLWTMADFWFPTLGISVLNAPLGCKEDYLNPFSKIRETVCGTVFTGKFSNPDAISTVDPTDLRIGVAISPRLSRDLGLRVAVDLHHIAFASGGNNYGLSEIPIGKKLHAGIELFSGNPLLPSPFSVSIGASQGFYTAGVSTRLGFLSLDFTSFGRDISATDSPKEDRRYLASISADF